MTTQEQIINDLYFNFVKYMISFLKDFVTFSEKI